jgi:hypothetical protein
MDLQARAKDMPPEPIAVAPTEQGADDVEHFIVCLECGQGFDRRNVAHVLYHGEPGHDPFFVES